MSIDLDKLKKLSMRVIIGRSSLVETLVAIPATEAFSSGSFQRLAKVRQSERPSREKSRPMSRIWVKTHHGMQGNLLA